MSFSFKDHNPYIIAEIGVNHEGSLDNAKMLIDLVKEVAHTPPSFNL